MEETKSDTSHLTTLGASPTGCNRRKRKLNIFSNPRACIEAKLRIFPSPRAYLRIYVDVGMKIEIFPCPRTQEEARAWNFSKSQGPYKWGEFVIFPISRDYMKAVLGIFPSPKAHIDMGVPNISSHFLRIPSYFFI